MINQFRSQQVFSLDLIRLVGYGLLSMAILDVFSLIIPLKLMNPSWELQTTGALVERTPVTLLGMALIYYGERQERTPIERFILKWLSWLSLILAIVFFLLVPLSISNSIRIYHSENAQVNLQVTRRIDPMNKFRQQLKSADSPEQIQQVLQVQARRRINIPDSVNTSDLKENLLKNITKKEENLRSQAKKIRSQKKHVIVKNCLKWGLGAIIAAFIFLFIWKSTVWARIKYDFD